MRKESILFWGISIVAFIVLKKIYDFIFRLWLNTTSVWNTYFDLFYFFLVLIIVLPAALYVASKLTKYFLNKSEE